MNTTGTNGTPAGENRLKAFTPPLGEGESPASPRPDGRDASGRFVKGQWKGGPGNPFGRKASQFRAALFAAVSEEDIHAIAGMLVQKSRAGDLEACALLFRYIIGRPDAPANPDRVDVEEWRLLSESPMEAEAAAVAVKHVDATAAVAFCRRHVPADPDRVHANVREHGEYVAREMSELNQAKRRRRGR
jgi:hypothetical protein